jgi:hypothetical protein
VDRPAGQPSDLRFDVQRMWTIVPLVGPIVGASTLNPQGVSIELGWHDRGRGRPRSGVHSLGSTRRAQAVRRGAAALFGHLLLARRLLKS